MEFQRKALSILRVFTDLLVIALVLLVMTSIFSVSVFSQNWVNLFILIVSILDKYEIFSIYRFARR